MTYLKKLTMQGFKSFAPKTQVLFDQGINTVVGPNGSGKSARWDTRILLASGEIKPIGEIVEESLQKSGKTQELDDGILTFENPLNTSVWGLDPVSMKIKECKIKAFIKRDGEPNLYTIKTGTGKEVTTTSCHPVLVYRDGEIRSEIVENLRDGDFIATPNKLNLPESVTNLNIQGLCDSGKYPLETARFLGYLVGDGCIIKNRRVDFVNADQEIIQDYKEIISQFGLKHSISTRKSSRAKCIYINSKKLANDLIDFFENSYKKEGKHIPKEIIFSKKNTLANFLGALFDCDASVRKDNPTFEYVTMSERLANEVVLSLLRFGIVARKTKKKKYAANTILKLKKDYYHITLEGREKLSKLYQSIPLKCNHKRALLKKWSSDGAIPNTNNDVLPQEINYKIRELVKLLGIKYKPLRKQYPLLAAYVENRCAPTRQGVQRIMPIFNQKLHTIIEGHNTLRMDVQMLTSAMDSLSISGRKASEQIGLHETIIRDHWANKRFNPRPENLEKFYYFIKGALAERIPRIRAILSLLTKLSTSDIFWDKIRQIDKVEGEDYVYDLEIEDTHNFIGNEVFVHNSNISDALCFALGRLSIKSMRAAKAKNLLFMGSKATKPAKEAWVEIVFDNANKTFNLPTQEVSLKRIVRHNGQSIYKINDETKTRSEVIETLAQAGIDPHGFNIILQGNIQQFVRMPAEERRKIIEEVAGISIYELRKEKSLKELEKTEARLKEISTVLRERTSFLRNLENERAQALKFKNLEETIKRCKASILNRKIDEKTREINSVRKSIEEKTSQKDKLRRKAEELQGKLDSYNQKINQINKHIQTSSGLEQDTLHEAITNLRAELEGLKVRKENYENRSSEIENRMRQLESSIPEYESEIKDLRKKSPMMAKKQEELKKKKEELTKLEDERKNTFRLKTELNALKERLKEKTSRSDKVDAESDSILNQIEEYLSELKYKDKTTCEKSIKKLQKDLSSFRESIEGLSKEELEKNKEMSSAETNIKTAEKIKAQVESLDTCPLCQNKMTESHIGHVNQDSDKKIKLAKEKIKNLEKELLGIQKEKKNISQKTREAEKTLMLAEKELSSHILISDKQEYMKKLLEEQEILKGEISELESRRESLEKKTLDLSRIEEAHKTKMLEIEEISSRTEKDLDTTLLYKERELEKFREAIKQGQHDLDEIEQEIHDLSMSIENKSEALEKKEEEDQKLSEKFKQLFKERDETQEELQRETYELTNLQNESKQVEDQVNYLKVGNAKLDAERESIEMELKDYPGIELLKMPMHQLEERLQKAQQSINTIGSINMRALEIYDEIKEEYDKVKEKADTIEEEKENIVKIIDEIDKKKRRTFMRTFRGINELFTRNFSQLSAKGEATLVLDNKEDIFNGGVSITIKMAKGKYFDVTSLSGGEQTLIALSLLFSIQEYKPYHFYIFDEIDAALDKRNSERLSALLKKYMQNGQYIVVTHNDAIITDSNFLYGVSMHEGISKILSLKLD